MTLNPFLRKCAQAFTRHVLRRFFSRYFRLELTAETITDEELNLRKVDAALRGGLATIGELRKMLEPTWGKTKKDDEWAGQGQGQQGGAPGAPAPGGAPGGGPAEHADPDTLAMQRQRPDNPEGQTSQGPRGPAKTLSDRTELLGRAMEKAFTNGHAKPVKLKP